MHALRILHCHGLPAESLHTLYKAVVVAKLTHATPAWWGFTAVEDRHQIDGLLRWGVRAGLYDGTQHHRLYMMLTTNCVLYNEQHVLHPLLS